MKNKLLTGLLSLGLLLPLGVNAETLNSVEEGSNTTNATVTVGEVETPVYEVEITWNSFQFDWKYNNETNEYEWQVGKTLDIIPLSSLENFDETTFNSDKKNICTDSVCKNIILDNVTYEEVMSNIEKYYYNTNVEQYTNHFHIEDYSTGGKIIPAVTWIASEDYQYVEGKIKYSKSISKCEEISKEIFDEAISAGVQFYLDSSCTEKNTANIAEYRTGLYFLSHQNEGIMTDLTTEIIPEDGIHYAMGSIFGPIVSSPRLYHLNLFLSNKTAPTSTPKTGDEIGTITIKIKTTE